MGLLVAEELEAVVADFVGAGRRVDVVDVLQDQVPLAVDEEGLAVREPGVLVAGAVGDAELAVIVGPELVGELLVLGPRQVVLGRAVADPDDLDAQGLELFVEVAVPATLFRSARGVGEGVEPHHRGVSDQVLWPPGLAELVESGKGGQRHRDRRRRAVQGDRVGHLGRGCGVGGAGRGRTAVGRARVAGACRGVAGTGQGEEERDHAAT